MFLCFKIPRLINGTRAAGSGKRIFNIRRVYLIISMIGALGLDGITHASESKLSFKRCSVLLSSGAMEIDAQCATFERNENPKDAESRRIALSVIKLPSHSPEPEPDAFTVIQGGPGGSSIDFAVAYSRVFEEIRKKRDIIVIDQRGTGRSNKLTCELPEELRNTFNLDLIQKATQKCLNELSKENDLRYYTTSIAVDDLEALRIAAGYSQLNLYGVSYGTRVVLHFLKKYPSSARTAVIDGVVQTGLNLAGGEIARRWEDSFEALNNRCQNEPSCANTHGDLYEQYQVLEERFKAAPVTVTVPHPTTGKATEYTFGEHTLFGAMRLMAYSTEQLALIPLLLSEAVKENYNFAAAQSLLMEANFADQFATGMHNSVVCTEDAPFVTADNKAQAKNTIVGEMMSDILMNSCSVWPKGYMDQDFLEPFSTEIPVLILSGETDPITPPENGEIAAEQLGNTKHIEVPAHGHGVVARGCVPNLVGLFVTNASFEMVDDTCTKRERPSPFFNTLTGPTP